MHNFLLEFSLHINIPNWADVGSVAALQLLGHGFDPKLKLLTVWSLALPVTMKLCVFLSLERALYIYIRSRSSSTEPVILHCHVSTIAQNGQTSSERLSRFTFLQVA